MKFIEQLSKQEQSDLLNKYKFTNDPGIKEKLILHNLRLVHWTVNRYYKNNKYEIEDLFQVGVIGLMECIEDYDSSRGSFGTHAVNSIRNTIYKDIRNNGDTIRIAEHMLQDIRNLKKIREELINKLERDPTPTELSIKSNMSIIKVNHILSLMKETLSLDSKIEGLEDDLNLIDTIRDESPTPDLIVEDLIFLEEFKELATKRLTRFQYDLIIMFCGLGHRYYSIKEIANIYNHKIEYVRQQKDKAFRTLRKTRYFVEISKELDDRTSFIKAIDYTKPKVTGGLPSSSVENIVLDREKSLERLKQKYKRRV